MNFYRTRKWIVALLALVLVVAMAGCKGESSPTAPSGTGGGSTGTTGTTSTTGTTTTPPVGATVTLTVSNSTPLINSSSTITATVASGGSAVPNGTAVEYQTDFGSFVQGASPDVQKVIKTTTGGVASVVLFSSNTGVATITATVNNVTKVANVTFVSQPVVNPPPTIVPTITGVSPSIGDPNGGQTITITGSNLRAPVSVLFDPANGTVPIPVAVVAGGSESAIQVITPKINIAAGQQQKFNITVITQQGSPNEQRVTSVGAFTFQLAVLTPAPTTASPASGPIDGGTRVTIFGSGFQTLVQVFFGAAEAQVIKVTFDQITVISPTALTAGVTTGAVNIRIINVNSATTATLTGGFTYAQKMTITAVGPTQGPQTGGTRVTIQGSGFDTAGVAVVIGGVAAQPVFVSGTQLIAITGAPEVAGCADKTGPTTVVNINNGDSATGVPFIFVVAKAVITNITSPVQGGANTQITVQNAFGTPRITIGGVGVPIVSATQNPDGSTTFTVVVPSTSLLPLTNVTCGSGALAPQQTAFDVVYTSVTNGCTDTLTKGETVTPSLLPVMTFTPPGFAPFSATITPANPSATPPTPATVAPSSPQTVTITNTGGNPLIITGISTSGSCSNFSIGPLIPPGPPVTLNQCDSLPIVARYNGQTTPVTDQCTVTVVSNAGIKSLSLIGSSQ